MTTLILKTDEDEASHLITSGELRQALEKHFSFPVAEVFVEWVKDGRTLAQERRL